MSFGGCGLGNVAAVQRDDAAIVAFLADGVDIAPGTGAGHGLAGQPAVKCVAVKIVARPRFADLGAVGAGKAVRDKAVIFDSVSVKA